MLCKNLYNLFSLINHKKMKKLNRIYIVGPQGSGKSTIANLLAKKIKTKNYDLDDIIKDKYGKRRNDSELKNMLSVVTARKKWVIEGIFGGWTAKAFEKSDLIILLNLNYNILVANLIKRYYKSKFTDNKRGINLKTTWKLIKHVKLYRTRYHPKSYAGHMELINKYKSKFIEIKTRKDLEDFLDTLK
jgi:adenylate kinase family enzyme